MVSEVTEWDNGSNIQEHGEELGTGIGGRSADNTADNTNKHQADNMQAAVIRFSRCIGHNKRDNEGGDPYRCGNQQSLDVAVAQGLDDSREEVLEILG
jgi:hypothetical protein